MSCEDTTLKPRPRLRKARELIDLTQEQVADKLNIHRDTVGEYERGSQNITLALLLKVCTLYQTLAAGRGWRLDTFHESYLCPDDGFPESAVATPTEELLK